MAIKSAVSTLILLALPLAALGSYRESYEGDNGYQSYYNPNYYVQYDLDVCYNSVIQVTDISHECDSPYTYYYGNGANRQSLTCAYGDKAVITIDIDVEDYLGEVPVYVKFEVEAGKDGDVVVSTSPKLVENFAGSDVSAPGSYTLYYSASLGNSNGNYGETQFTPYIKVAFSDQEDGGYDLGGANIECNNGYDESDSAVWATEDTIEGAPMSFRSVVGHYGILMLCIVATLIFGAYLYTRTNERLNLTQHCQPLYDNGCMKPVEAAGDEPQEDKYVPPESPVASASASAAEGDKVEEEEEQNQVDDDDAEKNVV